MDAGNHAEIPRPVHWTYQRVSDGDHLMQGDILARDTKLLELLERVHPHFCQEKYVGFQVITQSCDLVRRGNKRCDARHINICVIRPLSDLLLRFLDGTCRPITEGVYPTGDRGNATNLLSRVVNQNEQKLGLFFLHKDADAGIAFHSVSQLRVSIAIKRDHYDDLVAARRGRLDGLFQNKLGWLVGITYSRVATPDWDKTNCKSLIREILGNSNPLVEWIADEALAELTKFTHLPREQLLEAARSIELPEPHEQIFHCIEDVLREVFDAGENDDRVRKVISRLKNQREFFRAIKRAR